MLLIGFERGRRHVAQRGMQPFLVVDFFQKLADGRANVGQVAIFVAQHLFVLERFHERFAGCVGLSRQLRLMQAFRIDVSESRIHFIRGLARSSNWSLTSTRGASTACTSTKKASI